MNIGAHGQQDGIGAHWEMWSFVKGGWTPLQALQAATINPARTLGLERDLGSLENGKLADLVVLDANPLENIRNTDKVAQVMLGGRLYDAITLNERVTGNRIRQLIGGKATATRRQAAFSPLHTVTERKERWTHHGSRSRGKGRGGRWHRQSPSDAFIPPVHGAALRDSRSRKHGVSTPEMPTLPQLSNASCS